MPGDHKTFQLRYVGARFDGARLPLDVLSDLPAFRDLLVSYAKDRWRASNSDRQRLPKGFDKSISFDLIAIDEGSAMPKLDWSRNNAQAVLPGFTDQLAEIVDGSFDDLVRLIDDAGHSQFPVALSSEHVRALNKLGSGLRDGERIEFTGSQGADGKVVYLDTYRRKALITHVRETYQSRFEGIGRLVGNNILDGLITVITEEYGDLNIKVDPDRIKEEFDGNIGSDVQFAIQIELDNNDSYRSFIEAFDVELIDAKLSDNIGRCRQRLQELGRLSDGWLDGTGYAPSARAIDSAQQFLRKRPGHSGLYKIFPTPPGGVLFEFEINGWDLSVEFNNVGAVEMYGVQIDGPKELSPQSFEGLTEEFIEEFDVWTKG